MEQELPAPLPAVAAAMDPAVPDLGTLRGMQSASYPKISSMDPRNKQHSCGKSKQIKLHLKHFAQ